MPKYYVPSLNSQETSADSAESKAVKRFAGLALSRFSDICNAFCRWENTKTQVRNLFGRQAVPMLWDFAEPDIFGDNAGNYCTTLETMTRVVERVGELGWPTFGRVETADAAASPLPNQSSTVWFTDPPYYDSVPYAHLSDFFYVWLKRAANADTGKWFEATLTSKDAECVVDRPHSLSKSTKTPAYYESKMAGAMREGRRVLHQDGVGCVVFAHKTTEGWEALLSGILRAGFVITASWPITTEMANRMVARDTAALAGSVHLVCRPRPADAGIGDWSAVKTAMEKRIREWLPTLVKHGVRGADAIFSCLGPALESYIRYDQVLTAADKPVPLGGDPDAIEPHERGFLAYVFETLSKEALRQVLGDVPSGEALADGFEEDARMIALFLWTLQGTKANGGESSKLKVQSSKAEEAGDADDEDEDEPKKAKAGFSMPFDTFIRITRPMGIHYTALEHRLIEIDKGIVRLLPVRERSEQLLGETATRPGVEISLEDVHQLELGLLMKRREQTALPAKGKRGKKSSPAPGQPAGEAEFTALDRLHRAMLLFGLGRSTLLRQVLEKELKQSQRFERLALALREFAPLNSIYYRRQRYQVVRAQPRARGQGITGIGSRSVCAETSFWMSKFLNPPRAPYVASI